MQNWNDGKAQEFKDRKLYDVAHSSLKHSHAVAAEAAVNEASVTAPADMCAAAGCAAAAETKCAAPAENAALLFTTRTCPNCRTAEALLQKKGVAYTKVLAEEHADLCERYGIRQAPTLVAGGEKFAGLSEITKFAEKPLS